MYSSLSLLALGLATTVTAQKPGSISAAGKTPISAMMVRIFVMSPPPHPSQTLTIDVRRQ